MSDVKHASGPWEWSEAEYYPTIDLVAADGTSVLQIYESHGGGDRPNEANARLIAAAPDMLEALENAKGFLDTPISRRRNEGDSFFIEAVKSINAAISKAKGINPKVEDKPDIG